MLVVLFVVWLGVSDSPRSVLSDDIKSVNELSELESPVIDKGFETFLRQDQDLCRGGSQADSTKKQWIAVAVGRAALTTEDGKELSMSDATKIARTKAHRELAKLLHGFRMSAEDKSVTSSTARAGRSEIVELFRSVSKQEVDATLTRVEIVGTWKLDEGESIAVMVAVGDPKHPLFERRDASQPAKKLRKEHWEGNWRNIFATRSAILGGGASVYRQDKTTLILAVGKARLKGDELADRGKDLVASTNAAREALQLVKGLKVSSQSKVTQEYRRLTADEATIVSEASETLEKTTSEKLLGAIRVTKPVATWESDDGQYHFIAVAVKLSDLK